MISRWSILKKYQWVDSMTGIGIGLGEIKTYGELCEAIENTKKAIREVKNGPFYEQGDEFDLELHLIHLVKTKLYNEKVDELCMVSCNKCGSQNVDREKYYDFERLEYNFSAICRDCGYSETHTVDKKFDINQWVEENWVHHMPNDY